ncbi:MAG TPA: hypothetical protein ENF73_00060 [Proteobacteria bacterium]|nr:hypothetical protein [Pseudomonadota bacterium]
MGTDYRDTGSNLGNYEFIEDLEAQIGQPTKASQYNDHVENANFLFMSCMHGRRGHTSECDAKGMYECQAGRIWAIGKLTSNGDIQVIHNRIASGSDVTIPWDWTGRILTIHLHARWFSGSISDSVIDSYLPGGSNDEELWQDDCETFWGMIYTGPGREGPDNWTDYVWTCQTSVSAGGGQVDYLYWDVYVDTDGDNLCIRFRYTSPAGNTYKSAYVIDVAYSPRIPYYGEG